MLLKRNYKNWQLKKANDTKYFTPSKIEEQHSSKVVRADNKLKQMNMKSGISDKLDEDNQPILINPRMALANVKRITTKAPIQDIIPQKSIQAPEEIKLVEAEPDVEEIESRTTGVFQEEGKPGKAGRSRNPRDQSPSLSAHSR
jgi:hypothetical protein